MSELKFKRRELKIDVYGDKVSLRYPTAIENDKYQQDLLKGDGNEYKATETLMKTLGMTKKLFATLETPDLFELVEVITGQKKI